MARKKTHEEYINELFQKEINADPLEKYIGAKIPIMHECIEGHTWLSSPTNILNSKGCPECSKIDTTKYSLRVLNKNPEIRVLGEYVNMVTAIEHEHTVCGYKFVRRPHDFLNGSHKCPQCVKSIRKTTESYKKEIINTEFSLIESFTTVNDKVLHKHKTCGFEWLVRPAQILAGGNCPNCSNSGLKIHEPCSLYFVSFEYLNEIYYKIGITQRDIKIRFQGDWNKFNMKVLWTIELSDYHKAKNLESKYLNKYCNLKYNTSLLHSGNTETFRSFIEIDSDI